MKIIKLHTWEYIKNTANNVDNTGVYTPEDESLYIPYTMKYVFDEYYILSDTDYKKLQKSDFVYINRWMISKHCIKNVFDNIKQTPLIQISNLLTFDDVYDILQNYVYKEYLYTDKVENNKIYCVEVKEKRNEYTTVYTLYNNKVSETYKNVSYLCFYNVNTQHLLIYYEKNNNIEPAITVQLDIPLKYTDVKIQSVYHIYREVI